MTGVKKEGIFEKKIKPFFKIAVSAAKNWWVKDPFMQSSVIAYYAIFSIPGLLIMAISITSLFIQRDVITVHLNHQISSIMGEETAKQVQDMIVSIGKTNKSLLATIVGLVVVLLGATGVFVELQKTLNIIWNVKAKPRRAIFTMLRTRIFSFGLIVSVGFLLLISLVITTLIATLSTWVMYHWPNLVLILFHILNIVISFGVVMLLFALMFKFIPDTKIRWKHMWPGSFLTAFLFILGKTIIGFYLGKTNPGSVYGTAGSIVIILLWVSYSSMIFFYGAEFTHAYTDYVTGNAQTTHHEVNTSGLGNSK
jgi:membrane protein